jgi:hypothetical protein
MTRLEQENAALRAVLARLRSEYGGTNVQAIIDTALAASPAEPQGGGAGEALRECDRCHGLFPAKWTLCEACMTAVAAAPRVVEPVGERACVCPFPRVDCPYCRHDCAPCADNRPTPVVGPERKETT